MDRPLVVTLCGSSRFPDAFALANMHLTMRGCVVISLSCFGHADYPTGAKFLTSDGDENTPEKKHLDTIHFRKIDISDAIYVVNPGGYIGSSTKREIEYARSQGKAVEWMFPDAALSTAPAARPGDGVERAWTIQHAFLAGKEQAFEQAKQIVWDTASTGEAHAKILDCLMAVHRAVAVAPAGEVQS